MKKQWHLFKIDLRLALFNWRFASSLVFALFLLILSSWATRSGHAASTVIETHSLFFLTHSENSLVILGLGASLPYGIGLAVALDERSHHFYLMRTDAQSYYVSKVLAAAVSAFIYAWMVSLLFALYLRSYLPIFATDPERLAGGAKQLIGKNQLAAWTYPLLYLVISSTCLGLTAALWAGITTFAGLLTRDSFLALTLPLVVYGLLLRLSPYLKLSVIFQPEYLLSNLPGSNLLQAMLAKVIQVVIYLALVSYVGSLVFERQLAQE